MGLGLGVRVRATEGTLALSARSLAGCARGWPAQSKGQRFSEQSKRV